MGKLKRLVHGWRELLHRLSAFTTAVMFIASVVMISTFAVVINKPQHTRAAAGDMILFWDGTDYGGGALSVPTGWTEISSTYSGRMPRGEAAANFGTTGGTATHAHTNQTVAVTATNNSSTGATGAGLRTVSAASHSHDTLPSVSSIATASSEPATRTIRLIRYNSGIPTTVPNGAIVMFDDSPGMPGSGWTRLSVYDGKSLKIDTTAGTNAGADTHNHSITWTGSLGTNATSTNLCNGFIFLSCYSGVNVRTAGHTHTAPASHNSTTDSAIPPYVQPILAKANADTTISTVGITGMFDGSPGDLWTSRSESGGTYYRKFLRPGATYSSGGGTAYHKHTGTGTSGAASGGTVYASDSGGSNANSTHTHSVQATFYEGNSDTLYTGNNDYFLPQYFNVTIAERVTLSLNSYRWYDDNDSEAVTSPWSPLDLAINNMLPTLPAGYLPPVTGNELRLRIKILLGNQPLAAGDIAFKLQYKQGTDSSCTAGSWTDVGAGGGGVIWRFATSGVTDNTTLSTSVLASTIKELYSKSNPTNTNPNSAAVGETIEYDFHIEHNGATSASQYSFRLVESNGSVMSDYAQCPTLVTSPQTDNQLRHGGFYQDGVEKGFFWAN